MTIKIVFSFLKHTQNGLAVTQLYQGVVRKNITIMETKQWIGDVIQAFLTLLLILTKWDFLVNKAEFL